MPLIKFRISKSIRNNS